MLGKLRNCKSIDICELPKLEISSLLRVKKKLAAPCYGTTDRQPPRDPVIVQFVQITNIPKLSHRLTIEKTSGTDVLKLSMRTIYMILELGL